LIIFVSYSYICEASLSTSLSIFFKLASSFPDIVYTLVGSILTLELE
jgi:hypothetical protein